MSICMIGNDKGLELFWSQRVGWVTWDVGVDIRSVLKCLGYCDSTNIDLKYICGIGVVLNLLNAELNPICHLLALLGVHHFLHVSRISVKLLTLRLLMSYIYI